MRGCLANHRGKAAEVVGVCFPMCLACWRNIEATEDGGPGMLKALRFIRLTLQGATVVEFATPAMRKRLADAGVFVLLDATEALRKS